MTIRAAFVQVLVLVAVGNLWADHPRGEGEVSRANQFFDDGAFRKLQTDQARALHANGSLVKASDLAKQLERKTVGLDLPEAATAVSPMSPRELYQKCRQSVFSLAEVRDCEGCGEIHVTPYGTGFAITADGVLLTNHHLIKALESSSRLVASTADGKTYPVVEVLASSEKDDVAAIRIDGSGFEPLQLSVDNFVGTRVSVINHPRGHLYSLSEGIVTRLFTQYSQRTMLISGEYAVGSSGAPVLDSSGKVLGMVAATSSLNDQMILRVCIPTQSLLEILTQSEPGAAQEMQDPLATERACLKATFAAFQQLLQLHQQGRISSEEMDERFATLHSIMMHAIERCPDDPVAKQYSKVAEFMRKQQRTQSGEQDAADQLPARRDSNPE
ncbi:Putative serine protease HhoA precursor [Planctopirus ephydatiae]|uniref:Serine protease HhoA n=1 Tax=Planctopirus ephydatiae TaxID=2528019 RepID=A0A518GLZ9_9PLAN|nr:serine protease [Planctopirus ephydatiae]QDV29461.1 Putative serine protease HhoA precursor [Planctopirus ephydatiae]